jgi:pimeloyl-ACP methyl ester carboxylesterase
VPTADVNGLTLDYATRGREGDPVILLVMGLTAQRIAWPPELVDALVAEGFRVVTFDNRDVGRSTRLDDHPVPPQAIGAAYQGEDVDAPYGLADMAADAIALLDHLGIERVHVVGASMGGMIAQHLAFSHPGRVVSLTSIMSTTGRGDVGQATQDALAVLLTPPPQERELYIEAAVERARVISSPTLFDPERIRALAARVHERGLAPFGAARQLLAILTDRDRTERLARITAPTLVIHGAADALIDVSGGRATAEAIPDARLVVYEEMGHDLPLPLLSQITKEILTHVRAAESEECSAA